MQSSENAIFQSTESNITWNMNHMNFTFSPSSLDQSTFVSKIETIAEPSIVSNNFSTCNQVNCNYFPQQNHFDQFSRLNTNDSNYFFDKSTSQVRHNTYEGHNSNNYFYSDNSTNQTHIEPITELKIQEIDEDALKKQRRRERNKIAAHKCRLKKRKYVSFLISESNRVDLINSACKIKLNEIQTELNRLVQILRSHQCNLVKNEYLTCINSY